MKLRRHQALALDALARAWADGRTRAWVELPPGAGKTLVGLETARRLLAGGADKAVVLSPNTAIQGQWVDQAATVGLEAGVDRDLATPFTALTYQAVAVFDPDAEVTEEGQDESALMARLHDNGRALVTALRDAGPIVLVLDECHHLLEVWGRLLEELLDQLPDALVLGLTATPPETMTKEQAALVDELFGEVVFETSIPAVVREGDLAPFAELAWVTVPTAAETDWLASEATRFRELVTQLTDPEFGSVPFLSWLDARFLSSDAPWPELVRREPALCSAALRMHHAELLALPDLAVPDEEHQRDPTADDWVLLAGDWQLRHLSRTGDPRDQQVWEALRRALPAVGYVATKRGIRRGRSPVDRVLARSEAKTTATVAIVSTEHLNLGDRLRMLVLCDHERASATLPIDLRGVLDQESGSAHAVLAALLADPATAALHPLLVTGRTVAGAEDMLLGLKAAAVDHPDLRIEPLADGVATLVGPWSSRHWVRVVTRFFEAGGTRVLVGTRGLLGEGWDARRVTGLVDLTAVTTTTAVVQTRGRALRTDPAWPEKVALTWSVACVSDAHPKGGNDWDRLVRKHSGFYGVDERGDVVAGVAHLDSAFSAFEPPPVADFDAVNARMMIRSEDRDVIRNAWRVGEPYADRVARTVRILPSRREALGVARAPVVAAARADHLELRTPRPRPGLRTWSALLLVALAAVAVVADPGVPWILALVLAVALVPLSRAAEVAAYGRTALVDAADPPSVWRIGSAVADALRATGLVSAGSEAVVVDVDPDGEYRCLLGGVPEAESNLFATALDEAMAPIVSPRYVVPRWTTTSPVTGVRAVWAAYGRITADGEVWHPVPTVLAVNAQRAAAYAATWGRWVGGGTALYTGSPEGAGVLAAQRGSDPFDVATVMRRHWT
ncbi:MAG: DEAD/DEAH box helicase [Nocardioides sp.]